MSEFAKRNMKDGFYELSFNNDGVYISVYPPEQDGRKITLDEVLVKLGKKGVKGIDSALLDKAVREASRTPIKIAEPQEELKVDADVEVSITPDEMRAYVTLVEPDGGKGVTASKILDVLKQKGIVYGIRNDAIESLEKYPIYNQMICVAEGTPPEDGKDGEVKYNFDVKKQRRPAILADGRVDYRELNLVQSVKKGEMLCILVAPEAGKKGMTVTGKELKCKDGNPARIPKGRNVVLSDDGTMLFANIDGQIDLADGKVNVFSTFEVKADVDNSTGNINFIGNVLVRGNVLSGFRVEAGGNVEVWGVVEGAVINAGGDIILRRGMQGMGKGILNSGGDIVARYIENSTVIAKHDIKSEAIMHSHVTCGNKLQLSGKKGLLVGGTCRVGAEIEAKVIGSALSAFTEVEVGLDPMTREEFKKIREEIAVSTEAIRKAEQVINLLRKVEATGTLTDEKKEMLEKSVRTKLFHDSKLMELNERRREIEDLMRQESTGRIRCTDFVYPGTKISIGSATMFVKETLRYCLIYKDGADIKWMPAR